MLGTNIKMFSLTLQLSMAKYVSKSQTLFKFLQNDVKPVGSLRGREHQKQVSPFYAGAHLHRILGWDPLPIAIANTKPKSLPELRFHILHRGSVKCSLEQYKGFHKIIAHIR